MKHFPDFPILFTCIMISFFACQSEKEGLDGKQPNIVIFLVDDMGFSDLGSYGSEIKTPRIDQLASDGIRFTQMHNTAKCFPSRACLLTGLYAQQCNMDITNDSLKNAVTIGEVLREAGYRTLMVGKHHGLDNPYDRGFDRYFGLRDGASNHFNPGMQREGEPVPAHKDVAWAKPRKWCIDDSLYAPYTPTDRDFYTTDYFTRYALTYLDQYRDEDKPFLLYVAYTAPHDPLHAWPEDIRKYLGTYMEGYKVIRKRRYARQMEIGLIDDTYPLSEPTHQRWSDLTLVEQLTADSLMAVYAAMIDRVDQNVGKIIDKIMDMGKYENTIFMFMSDNGCQPVGPGDGSLNPTARDYPIGSIGRWASLNTSWANVGNTPFRYYKNWSHEGGTCTPFIVCWPAKKEMFNTGISEFPAHFIDIMPTLLEISGANYPEFYNGEAILPYEGMSLMPVFEGEVNSRATPLFWQWNRGKAVRKDQYKLVSGNDGPWELYDMESDKTETVNIIESEPEKAMELEALYLDWLSRVKD